MYVSPDATTPPTPVTPANPFPVRAGGFMAVPSDTKTRPADINAYAVGDVVANSTSAATVWTFTNCVRANGGTGAILGVQISDSAKQSILPQFDLWLFNAAPTTQQDNVAFNPSAGDLANVVDIISLTAFRGGTSNGMLTQQDINRPFKCGADANLYGILVAANGYTPVSGEAFTIKLKIGQD
jgi:hypothetical protein